MSCHGVTQGIMGLVVRRWEDSGKPVWSLEKTIEEVKLADSLLTRDGLGKVKHRALRQHIVQGDEDKASVDFIIKTKMDSPIVSFSSIKKTFRSAVPMTPGLIAQGAYDKGKRKLSEGVKRITPGTVDKAIDAIKDIIGDIKVIFNPPKDSEVGE